MVFSDLKNGRRESDFLRFIQRLFRNAGFIFYLIGIITLISISLFSTVLEKGMATHSNILAPGIPRTGEPDGLQSTGLQKTGHNWATKRRRQWHPTPVLLPGKSHGWRSLVGCSPWGHEESDMTEWLRFHALEREMATNSSVLAWRIPAMGEPGGLPSMGSHRVRQDWSNLAAAAEPLTHTHTLLYKTKTVKYLVNLKMNWKSMKVFPEFKFNYHQSMKSLADNWYYDGIVQ